MLNNDLTTLIILIAVIVVGKLAIRGLQILSQERP
jgi:hypothetical protein